MNYLDSLVGNYSINLACQLMVYVVIIINFFHIFKGKIRGTGYVVLWVVTTFYSVFYSPIGGDNFSSIQNYYLYKDGISEEYLHFESIYFRIMDLIPNSYVLWRFFIWGIGLFLMVFYIKMMKFSVSISTISILYFSLPLLYYQRAIIGYVLIYIGLSLLINALFGKTNLLTIIFNIIIATLCFMGALSFHTTMVFYVCVALLSILLYPKRYLVIIVIVVALLISQSLPEVTNFLISKMADETQNTANFYLENAKHGASATIFGYIALFVQYAPYYCMLLYCIWNISNKSLSFTRYEKVILINTFILVLVSILFSSVSIVIQGKFYTASLLPWGLFVASYYSRMRQTPAAQLYMKVSVVSFVVMLGINLLSTTFGG